MKKPAKSRKSLRSNRRTLWVIALLLAGSAALRAGLGASDAIALESEDVPEPEMHAESMEDSNGVMKPKMQMEGESCKSPAEIAEVLKTLSKRDAMLTERETALKNRLAALALAEQEIKKNLAALQEAEAALAATISVAETAAENDLTRLTSVYANMKPKDASALFEEMSPNFAAGFLARMKPDAAAAIMAGLESTTAYSISVIMAGRNANVPTE